MPKLGRALNLCDSSGFHPLTTPPLDTRHAPSDAAPMSDLNLPLQLLLLTFAGWVIRGQQGQIDSLLEENRVLRELLPDPRPRLNDHQRLRLALKGKSLGRQALAKVAGIVTPDTILRWYQKLIATKDDGSKQRRPGRPRTEEEIAGITSQPSAAWMQQRSVGSWSTGGAGSSRGSGT